MSVVRESEVWAEIVAKTGQSKKEIFAILTDPAASFGREWENLRRIESVSGNDGAEVSRYPGDRLESPLKATKAMNWADVRDACLYNLFEWRRGSIYSTSDYWLHFVMNVIDAECEKTPLNKCDEIDKFALVCLLINELRVDTRIPHQSIPKAPLPVLPPPEDQELLRRMQSGWDLDISLWVPEWATMWGECLTDDNFNCDPGGMGSPLAAHHSDVALGEPERTLDQILEDVALQAKAKELRKRLKVVKKVLVEERKSKMLMDKKASRAIRNAKATELDAVATLMRGKQMDVGAKLKETLAAKAELERRLKEAEALIPEFLYLQGITLD